LYPEKSIQSASNALKKFVVAQKKVCCLVFAEEEQAMVDLWLKT